MIKPVIKITLIVACVLVLRKSSKTPSHKSAKKFKKSSTDADRS